MANTNPFPAADGAPLPEPQGQRRLSVIMFTDIVGYSALTQRDEALALRLLEEHCQLVRPLLNLHGGREIKTIGDAFLIEFSSAYAAAKCAIAIQEALHKRNLAAPHELRIDLRIGLHAGDVVHRDGDVFGDGVNIAARIEPLAEPGGICVSEDVARLIQNKIGSPLVKLGFAELKNITMPVAIYRIVLPWQDARRPQTERLAFLFQKRSVRRVAAAVLLALALAGIWRAWPRVAGVRAAAPTSRLAVLPLVNFSGDARDGYFADGMTEELISSLSNIRELTVIARTSIAKFKGTQLDVTEIGRALEVGSLLEGTIRVAGDQARINVSLVDVRSQKTIWTQEYNSQIKDVFAVQSAIAVSVTDALKVQLLSAERDLLDHKGTDNSEAYREYLIGRAHLDARTGDEVVRSIENFSQSVSRDPRFALAYAGLAEAYTLAGNAGYGDLPRDEAIEKARSNARRAIALDDSLAEAHASLAYVRFRIDWDWAGAEAEFQRALDLKPGYARAHEWYGLFLSIRRHFDASLAEMKEAQKLDPLSPSVNTGVGRVLHFQRRFQEAVAQFRRTLELDPTYAEAYLGLGLSYVCMGRHEESLAALRKAVQLSGNRQAIVGILGVALARAGQRVEAQKIHAMLEDQLKTVPMTALNLTNLEEELGENDQAFAHLEQACRERDGVLIYTRIDPISEGLWRDPRFAVLMRKIGLED